MESQGQQNSGGGGGTETGEGEDEESSSSSNLIKTTNDNETELRGLLDDEIEKNGCDNQEIKEIKKSTEKTENVLEEFRQKWRTELQKAAAASSKSSSRDSSPAISQKESSPKILEKKLPNATSNIYETASRLFQNGIDLERQGKMYEAIRSYRQALFLVPDIEKRLLSASTSTATGGGKTYAMAASESIEDKHCTSRGTSDTMLQPTTEQLIEIFRHRLFITNGGTALYTPATDEANDEAGQSQDKPVQKAVRMLNDGEIHISHLPVEVLMKIFKWVVSSDLDLRQLENLSMVSCGFYIVARDPDLWRLACLKVWGVRLGPLDSVYPSWRQMYLERPHIWFNGVYISKMTYVRHGETAYQDQFYRPWHLVIYYRYLRFFSDGTMLMLTTPEEPSTIVPGLKFRQPRFQGILHGTYRLIGQNCVAGILNRKAAGADQNASPYFRNRFVKQPTDLMEHVFSLVLDINSIKNRRHVQLAWSSYEVTSKYRNGQSTASKFELCDENFPPLHFSRVKSFTATSEESLG